MSLRRINKTSMAKEEKKELTKEEKLDALVNGLNAKFGVGTIINKNNMPEVETLSTGTASLDEILGGGLARGRMVEISGNESSGKTTIGLQTLAGVQLKKGIAAFIDAEHALSPSYARELGVDTDSLLITQPDTGEEAISIAEDMCDSGIIDAIVIDSVAALIPRAELEGEMTEQQMGLQARLMSKAMRKLTGTAAKSKTLLIFINQFRDKIGMYGGGRVTTGGNALKFYASQRLELFRPNKPIEKNGKPIGVQVEAKVVKNKISPPFQTASLFIRWGEGIDRYIDILRLSANRGLIVRPKNSSWYTYNDIKIQGEDAMAEYIKENNLYEELVEKLK